MNIIRKKLRFDIKDEGVRIHLSQIRNPLNEITKRIADPEKQWQVVKSVLDTVASTANSTHIDFVVFPEIAVPHHYVPDALGILDKQFPRNSIVIFGVELSTVDEWADLARQIRIKDRDAQSILRTQQKDRLVNACVIAVKERNTCRTFLQLKMTPSKFEGGVVTNDAILASDYVYYFRSQDSPALSFMTLICSDFFNRPDGALPKIIDDVDFGILKQGQPLDFLFNIQHNRSPDNELFLQGLSRIYDDGYGAHGDLCTIFLNAVLDGGRKGGLSKIMFYKGSDLPEKQPIKQVDAPIVGYEIDEEESLACVQFKRLPRSWDRKRDNYPVHITCLRPVGQQWQPAKDAAIRYLAPMPTEAFLDHSSYKELADRCSVLGRFDDSIYWTKKRLSYWEKRRDFHEAALASLFMAIQFRHKGSLNEALKHYASAEALIRELRDPGPGARLTWWRIRLGRIMVDDFMINGRCKQAYEEYKLVEDQIDEYLNAHSSVNDESNLHVGLAKIRLYKIHLRRQCAEMLRLMGSYERARALMNTAYEQYSYAYAEEKAYSALGEADCLRLLGCYVEASAKYQEVCEFATEKRQKRLLARVLRNKAELLRVLSADESLEQLLGELTNLSGETEYRLGKIYIPLISGGAHLKTDPRRAIEVFSQIERLVPPFSQDYLKVEYAHYTFGMAEAKRLCGDLDSLEYYERAENLYKETGVLWGIVRTRVGLTILGRAKNELDRLLGGLTITDPLDLDFIERVRDGKVGSHETLFLNIP